MHCSERWWVVVGWWWFSRGEVGVFAIVSGDLVEFGALAAFVGDAGLAGLFAGLFAARHHCGAADVGEVEGRGWGEVAGGLRECGVQVCAVGCGGLGVPGGGSQHDGAVGALFVVPAQGGVEGFDQVVAPTD